MFLELLRQAIRQAERYYAKAPSRCCTDTDKGKHVEPQRFDTHPCADKVRPSIVENHR